MSYFFIIAWDMQYIKGNCFILFKFFPILLVWRKAYFIPIVLTCKRLDFCSFWMVFNVLMFYCHRYSILKIFFFKVFRIYCYIFFFSHFGEFIYDSPKFHDICNPIDQRYQKQIHYFSLILLSLFDISVKENQKVLSTLISLLSLFECTAHVSLVSLDDKKLVAIDDWIFHLPCFL